LRIGADENGLPIEQECVHRVSKSILAEHPDDAWKAEILNQCLRFRASPGNVKIAAFMVLAIIPGFKWAIMVFW
jgi:hypothetical protein